MANVSDDQQTKGNLGGPDLFLAPIGRLEEAKISKYFCNTCEKEFEGAPKIQYENPNEEVAENLILVEKGQYLCDACSGTIAEYREFKKQDEAVEIGSAKQLQPEPQIKPQVEVESQTDTAAKEQTEDVTQPSSATSTSSIEGRMIFDENANMVGKARQVGTDANQSIVLLITKKDGTEASVPWDKIRKIGEVILLGSPQAAQPPNTMRTCDSCGFVNKEGSKFCEECGDELTG